jgi:hypothetical protein
MGDKSITESRLNDDKSLTASLVHTLDESLDNIDDLNVQRLKNARLRALGQAPASDHKWIKLSIAASLAAFVFISIAWHQYPIGSTSEQEVEVVSQDVPYTADEMDDIEMLMALGDGDA